METSTTGTPLNTTNEELKILLAARKVVRTPLGGWLRYGRKAGEAYQQHLAAKLGSKRQAWAQLEASEAREAISLNSLRRAAAALECDLVYFLVPRGAVGGLAVGAGNPNDDRAKAGEEALPPPTPGPAATGTAWVESELPTELR